MRLVVLVEVSIDGIERGGQYLLVRWLREHVEVDRLEQLRGPFDGSVNDVVFPDLAAANDLRVRDAVRGTQRFLRCEREITFDLEALARMDRRVNRPRRIRQELTLLVLRREAVGLREPAVDRLVLARDDAPLREEVVRERRARRAFDHLLEAAARNDLRVNVDAVLDEDAEDALVRAVAWQST